MITWLLVISRIAARRRSPRTALIRWGVCHEQWKCNFINTKSYERKQINLWYQVKGWVRIKNSRRLIIAQGFEDKGRLKGLSTTLLSSLTKDWKEDLWQFYVGLHWIHVYLFARHSPCTANSTLGRNFDNITVKMSFRLVTNVGQRKIFESPRGVSPQTRGIRAPPY